MPDAEPSATDALQPDPGQSDPVLALLWRDRHSPPPVRRGPKQKVTIDEVVATGIAMADADGLAALSMRGVAQRLSIGAMSLYTYVPGRDELVVLMVDEVLQQTRRPPHGPDLRTRLRAVAESAYDECNAHPWLLEVDGLRAWLGPGAAERYEWQLAAVDGIGLSDVDMDQAVTLLLGIASTAARAVHVVRAAERRSGQTELEWWEANAEALGEAMAGRDFPLADRVGSAAGEEYQAASDPDRQFRFAIDVAIDGLMAHRVECCNIRDRALSAVDWEERRT